MTDPAGCVNSPASSPVGGGPRRSAAARRLVRRAARRRARAFLVEGPRAVEEAYRAAAPLTDLFVTAAAQTRHAELVRAVTAAGVPVHVVDDRIMDRLAQTVTPQGMVAVCDFVDVPLEEALGPCGDSAPEPPQLVAVLAGVRDPGNAGTALRVADAAGAAAVIFTAGSVDVYNSKCVRASAGSLFHVPVVAGVGLDTVTRALRLAGVRVVAADPRSDRSLDNVSGAELADPTAWVFGNESWGLPSSLDRLVDARVAVPIYGKAESLNLATAVAVCLYSSARAQRAVPAGTTRSSVVHAKV